MIRLSRLNVRDADEKKKHLTVTGGPFRSSCLTWVHYITEFTLVMSDNIQSLIDQAKDLHIKSFSINPTPGSLHITTAPGRVNLIGEHTDYTGGFVLPLAIGYSTVCYGRGSIIKKVDAKKCRVVSINNPECVVEFEADLSARPSTTDKWANYVQGVVLQYLPDLQPDETFNMDMSIAGDVPLGSGLSSSASLEVATAVFLEALMKRGGVDSAFMKSDDREKKKERAVRCQRAENMFCNVPCGVMVCVSFLCGILMSTRRMFSLSCIFAGSICKQCRMLR